MNKPIQQVLEKVEEYTKIKSYFDNNKEAKFQSDVKNLLREIGILSIKMPSALEKALVLPDLLCLVKKNLNVNTQAFFIEMKRSKKGKLSPIQKATFTILKDYIDIYSVYNWNDFKNVLMKIVEN